MIGLAINRRTFLTGAGAGFLSVSPLCAESDKNIGETLFVSAFRDPSGHYGVAILDEYGDILFQEPLPSRGHGVASHEDLSKAIIFARRPGNFALALDTSFKERPLLFQTQPDRHFYGHGVFSNDGKLLYATENDFDAARGMIGIYDVTDSFRRIGEFFSGGVGPHDILLMDDGVTLCVANGGIETHPEFGRRKLNLDRMKSNISFIHAEHGDVLKIHHVPLRWSRLSLRHMAVDRQQRVWFGGQYEGNALEYAPIIGSVTFDNGFAFMDGDRLGMQNLHNYIGSVAVNNDRTVIALSAPKAGKLLLLDANKNSLIGTTNQNRVCGVAANSTHKTKPFISSSELGQFSARTHPYNWDNHIGKTPLGT